MPYAQSKNGREGYFEDRFNRRLGGNANVGSVEKREAGVSANDNGHRKWSLIVPWSMYRLFVFILRYRIQKEMYIFKRRNQKQEM